MSKKYIFLDLDGTIINHKTHTVPESTIEAVRLLQEGGHTIVLSTGRVPSLFYGIDKLLNIKTYIAANGKLVVHNDEIILEQCIDKITVQKVVDLSLELGVDLGFESKSDYVLNTNDSGLAAKFSDYFHLEHPVISKNYHLHNNILQMALFYVKPDFKKFEEIFPNLSFNYANQFGIDINLKGGLKELGIKALIESLKVNIEDTIAVGDGFNDISMIQFAGIGIAMGNACQELKDAATYVTDDVDKDGLFNIFKKLELI